RAAPYAPVARARRTRPAPVARRSTYGRKYRPARKKTRFWRREARLPGTGSSSAEAAMDSTRAPPSKIGRASCRERVAVGTDGIRDFHVTGVQTCALPI